jgi:hypothetical protein
VLRTEGSQRKQIILSELKTVFKVVRAENNEKIK